MKLTTTTFVSVDGVMQGIGGPDEDNSGPSSFDMIVEADVVPMGWNGSSARWLPDQHQLTQPRLEEQAS